MSVKYEKIIGKFCEDENLTYDKEFLPKEENERINEEYINGNSEAKENILKLYDYDYDEDTNRFYFYKLIPSGITKEELNQYISMKTLQNLRQINVNVRTIKSVIMFWFILSLIVVAVFVIGLLSSIQRFR